ncbi:MAG: hypothetical protein KatS3mg050_2973 [Litorilinea sp.]|nr:MAG: hypothetical protein KatS3mg050_2973 [Litorilinea sp.]
MYHRSFPFQMLLLLPRLTDGMSSVGKGFRCDGCFTNMEYHGRADLLWLGP